MSDVRLPSAAQGRMFARCSRKRPLRRTPPTPTASSTRRTSSTASEEAALLARDLGASGRRGEVSRLRRSTADDALRLRLRLHVEPAAAGAAAACVPAAAARDGRALVGRRGRSVRAGPRHRVPAGHADRLASRRAAVRRRRRHLAWQRVSHALPSVSAAARLVAPHVHARSRSRAPPICCSDTIRWGWQHSIPDVPSLRWSITFRTMRDTDSPSITRTADDTT